MTRQLPAQPDLDHLKKQAKRVLRGLAERHPQALERTPLGWALHGSENGWHKDSGITPAWSRRCFRRGPRRPGSQMRSRPVSRCWRYCGAARNGSDGAPLARD